MKHPLPSRLAGSFLVLLVAGYAFGVEEARENKFRQLGTLLPTANDYRTASGAPGHEYWHQRADYRIAVELDDATQHLRGSEKITYHNNSPDALEYLWLQLDGNIYSPDSHSVRSSLAPDLDESHRAPQRSRPPAQIRYIDRRLRGFAPCAGRRTQRGRE